jgi:hypothetical protein
VTPSEALQHIVTFVEASADLKDTHARCCYVALSWSPRRGLGVAPDGVAECEPNVLTFPTR